MLILSYIFKGHTNITYKLKKKNKLKWLISFTWFLNFGLKYVSDLLFSHFGSQQSQLTLFRFWLTRNILLLNVYFYLWAVSPFGPDNCHCFHQSSLWSRTPSLALLAHPPSWNLAKSLVLEVSSRFFSVKNKRFIESSQRKKSSLVLSVERPFLPTLSFFAADPQFLLRECVVG